MALNKFSHLNPGPTTLLWLMKSIVVELKKATCGRNIHHFSKLECKNETNVSVDLSKVIRRVKILQENSYHVNPSWRTSIEAYDQSLIVSSAL